MIRLTLEEKLVHLRESAMTEARIKGNGIIEQHKNSLLYVYEQHQAEASRQSETRIRAEKTNMKQQISMASSKASLEIKRDVSKMQMKLKKELFEEVEEKLAEYMKTPEYKRLLITYIQKAAEFAGGEEMTIYINPTDEDKKEYLEEHTGMTLKVSKEDFIGGVRGVIPGRNILVDHAFKGGLEREYRKFVFKGGTGIG